MLVLWSTKPVQLPGFNYSHTLAIVIWVEYEVVILFIESTALFRGACQLLVTVNGGLGYVIA
jgi:hypothetical protein